MNIAEGASGRGGRRLCCLLLVTWFCIALSLNMNDYISEVLVLEDFKSRASHTKLFCVEKNT